MVGITLTPEQIRTAPPDVRRWLEQELAKTFGLRPSQSEAPQSQLHHEHLVACSVEEVTAILNVIQGMLPVVNVFFELGRHAANLVDEGLAAFRLTDMLHHTRLQNLEQVIDCLRIINEATQQVRDDPDATLYALDQYGDCYVAAQTQQSILRLWLQVVGGQVLRTVPGVDEGRTAGLEAAAQPPSFTQGNGGQQGLSTDSQAVRNSGPFVRQAVA
jgi:hypothetical protein